MQRLAPSLAVVVVGLFLLADYLLVNPVLAAAVGFITEYLILLTAAAAIAGTLALVRRHGANLLRRRGDRIGSLLVLFGIGSMLVVGLAPGSTGADDPRMRWLVASLMVPLLAAIFALLPIFALRIARRGLGIRRREATLMLAAAAIMLLLLLPLAGAPGTALAAAAGLLLDGPLTAVFRGLLIAIAVATAISAARLIFGVAGSDD